MKYILVFVWVIISKAVFDLLFFREVKIEREIFQEKNTALALSYAGFLLSVAILIYNTFTYYSFWEELFTLVFLTLILLVSVYLFDLIFLKKIDLKREILSKNSPAGLTQAIYFIASSLILSGAYWDKESLLLSFSYSLLYLTLGYILLFVATFLLSRILKLDFEEEIKNNNLSASVALGGLTLSVSVVIFSALSGESFGSLFMDILITLLYFVLTLILMLILYLIFEYVVFRKVKLSHEILENNLSASLVVASLFFVSALLSVVIMG